MGNPLSTRSPAAAPSSAARISCCALQQPVHAHDRLGSACAAARERKQRRVCRQHTLSGRGPTEIAASRATGRCRAGARGRSQRRPARAARPGPRIAAGAPSGLPSTPGPQLPAAALDVAAPGRQVDEDGDQTKAGRLRAARRTDRSTWARAQGPGRRGAGPPNAAWLPPGRMQRPAPGSSSPGTCRAATRRKACASGRIRTCSVRMCIDVHGCSSSLAKRA